MPMYRHWPFLDAVRFGAALLVLFGHTRGLFFVSINDVEKPSVLTRAFYLATSLQHEAVVLFFVVSGFLVGGAAWKAVEEGHFRWREYLLSRFARIYIVLAPALAAVFLIQIVGQESLSETRLFGQRPLFPSGVSSGFSWAQVPCHLASLQGLACTPWGANPPLWSLGYEWSLYLIAPMFFLFARSGGVAGAIGAIIGAATLVTLVSIEWQWFVFWGLGAGGAWAISRGGLPAALGWCALILCAVAMVVSRLKLMPLAATDYMIALSLAAAVATPKVLAWCPRPRLMAWGAAFSFSLYLLHLPMGILVGAMLEKLGMGAALMPPGAISYGAFTITVAAVVVFSFGFSRLTEARTAAFKDWLRRPQAVPLPHS